MSRTVPSPNIDIGIRPITAAAEKRQAPGIRKISAYGRSERVNRPAGERLTVRFVSSTLVIGRIAPQPSRYLSGAISFLPRIRGSATRGTWPSRVLVGWKHAGLRRVPACLVRWPGRPRRRDAFPAERHPRPRYPAGAARQRGGALRRGRRGEPDQPAVPGQADRGPGRFPGQRAVAAAVLGEPELVTLPGRHAAGHGR